MTDIPPVISPTPSPRRSYLSAILWGILAVIFVLVGAIISYFGFCVIVAVVTFGLLPSAWNYPKDEKLIAMFHKERPQLEQLKTMFENDSAPRFSKYDFSDYNFHAREFTGRFSARALLDAIAAQGIEIPEAQPGRKKFTEIQSLNKLLAREGLYEALPTVVSPKEAAALLDRESGQYGRIKFNRLILQGTFPHSCPKKLSPEEEARALATAIIARGIAVPEAPTAMESLNRLLSGPSLHGRFENIKLPEEADGLLAQVSSLRKGERIKLNRLIVEAVFPKDCPKTRGGKLEAVYDTWAISRWLGWSRSYFPDGFDLASLGVTEERFKQYQCLLRRVSYQNASVESGLGEIRITVCTAGLSISGAIFKGYVYRRTSPGPKAIVPSLDYYYEKPKCRGIFYRHLEDNWYLYLQMD